MKRTIKLSLVNFWPGFDFENSPTYKILSKHFSLVIVDENPDFVLCSLFGDFRKPLKYSCPRLLFIGEPQTPDFSLYDYAIGFDFMSILDKYGHNRYFRFPVGFWEWHNELAKEIEKPIKIEHIKEVMKEKTMFCNFIYGYETVNHERERVLESISKYKKVDCCGKYRNNMPDGFKVSYSMEKIEHQKKYKFSIAGENTCFPGLVTEKIIHAFFANSVPIYIGDPLIEKTFNEKAFINANNLDENELIRIIKNIDENDEIFLEMLAAQKYAANNYYTDLMKGYEDFLVYIFSQDSRDAIRRQNAYFALKYEKSLLESSDRINKESKIKRFFKRIINKSNVKK